MAYVSVTPVGVQPMEGQWVSELAASAVSLQRVPGTASLVNMTKYATHI